jgi:hypothetical protein
VRGMDGQGRGDAPAGDADDVEGRDLPRLPRIGFSLPKLSQKLIDRMTSEMSTDEVVAQTRATAGVQSAPPGLKPMGVLGEVLVHSSALKHGPARGFQLRAKTHRSS